MGSKLIPHTALPFQSLGPYPRFCQAEIVGGGSGGKKWQEGVCDVAEPSSECVCLGAVYQELTDTQAGC